MIPRGHITAWRTHAPWVMDAQVDADLAGIRDPEPLSMLSEAEQEACLPLWDDYRRAISQLEAAPERTRW